MNTWLANSSLSLPNYLLAFQEEETECWFTGTLIAFYELPISGLPPEGSDFGTISGIAPKGILVVLETGYSPRSWTSPSRAYRLEQRWVPIFRI